MKYASVDMAFARILRLEKGALLVKVDIECAYNCNIQVHKDNRHLLGMVWKGKQYINTVLPFGPHSAPKILSSVANALEWISLDKGI